MKSVGKAAVSAILIALLLTYPLILAPVQAQSPQADRIQKLISILENESARLEKVVKSRVTNATKQQELLSQLSVVKELLDNASRLANAGSYNESLALLREARAELVSVSRQLVPVILGERKKFVARSLEAEIRALQNQIKAMQNVASRMQEKSVNASQVLSLLNEASGLLDQASEKLKANDTAGAAQLVEQAWGKVKEAERLVFSLATQLRARYVSKDLEHLKAAFNVTYARLSKVAPEVAEEFRAWFEQKVSKIEALVSAGKNAEALAELRRLMLEYRDYMVLLTQATRLENLARAAKQLAGVVRPCNATLARELEASANALLDAIKSRDMAKVLGTSQNLRSLMAEARFACRARRAQGKP
ncbi:hypothetical protein [Infirmifilum sp. SLHALR2]|nr:MAG: hypothetical protein B7L53_06180 [Thermofilum sp. NZ13]